MKRPFPLVTGTASVAAVEDLTPRMRRITLEAEAFRDLPVAEPGEILTLLWPEPGRELVLPEEGWRFPPGVADRQHARNYTVRHWQAGSDRVDVDFVLHGDSGLASRWAEAAGPGDPVGFAGSRTHWTRAPEADWVLLVADETGLPALAAIAAELSPGTGGHVLVEAEEPAECVPIPSPAELEVRWIYRQGGGHRSDALAGAVAELALPAGSGRAWGGGEALSMRTVRRHLADERGLGADAMSLLGYWKHATTRGWG